MLKNFFSNKNISLALGSGSAKGIAHIGIIEALEDNGFIINAVAGTSIGGIVGAFYSLGKLHILKEWILSLSKADTFKIIDLSLTGGFISGKRLMSYFSDMIGKATFNDTKIPLFIPATNLDTGLKEVFTSGEIIPAIRASISVPAVFKPFFYNGSYYVDGAVTDPVPISILKDNGYKNIVAVHLNKYLEKRENDDKPSIIETAGRSMSIVSKTLAESLSGEEKVLITPNLSEYHMFEVHKAKEIIEIGYNTTMDIINSGKMQGFLDKIINFNK